MGLIVITPSIPVSVPDGVWPAAEKETSIISSIKAAKAVASFIIQNLAENSLVANDANRPRSKLQLDPDWLPTCNAYARTRARWRDPISRLRHTRAGGQRAFDSLKTLLRCQPGRGGAAKVTTAL